MRKTALRTLELLETEERSRQETHQSSLAATAFLCWKVVFAHYLGDLKPDDEDPGEAGARALGYNSQYEYLEALFKGEIAEIKKRFKDACRRLFGQLGLDFDRSPPSALFEAFVRLVDQLPEPWLKWIESLTHRFRVILAYLRKSARPRSGSYAFLSISSFPTSRGRRARFASGRFADTSAPR